MAGVQCFCKRGHVWHAVQSQVTTSAHARRVALILALNTGVLLLQRRSFFFFFPLKDVFARSFFTPVTPFDWLLKGNDPILNPEPFERGFLGVSLGGICRICSTPA